MANRFEIAQYLVNLHTLMQAQSSSGLATSSTVLANEYHEHWDLLKDAIANDDKPTEGRRV